MDRRGAVAQDGVGPTGENRRHPPRLVADPIVAYRIHAAMHAMQPSAPGALGDCTPRQSHPDELLRRHDPVLDTRDTRYLPIERGTFVAHEDTKAPRGETLPPLAAEDGL